MPFDTQYMRLALELARSAVGKSNPNPPVGAVVVQNDKIVGKGFTSPAGGAHAEVNALAEAGVLARGADLWVTLEPCSHFGRTPPCTLAIQNAGIKRVFYSYPDPNPIVNSKTKAILEASQIEVFENILIEESSFFYKAYAHFVRNKRCFIELKVAQTQDGFIAGPHKQRLAITKSKANQWTNRLRAYSDAILIGGGTLEIDKPSLSLRGEKGNAPQRIFLVGSRLLSPHLEVFKSNDKVIVYSYVKQPAIQDSCDFRLLQSRSFSENWSQIIQELSKEGVHRLMVEPGAMLSKLILETNLWDQLHVWVSSTSIQDGTPWAFKVQVPYSNEDQLISIENFL